MATATISVVVADDVEAMRSLARLALELHDDIEVVAEAADGHEALDRVRELAPDVLLLDISMPGLDGLEVLERVDAAAPLTAVVVLSGFAAARMADRTLALGAHSYLEKSASMSDIARTVRAAAGAARG